ncbi:hypothetical protein B0J11DRAFT_522212 [Dendryphion nanum]|uniref:Uncharacterized protein n=1 Tax=Dendryphion nanum TaxID=256645 RepID=A0A9P9E832_9PLEO|nr:hypothetical protein B0J11DRAFT_522212 [Dendryphion nanum]
MGREKHDGDSEQHTTRGGLGGEGGEMVASSGQLVNLLLRRLVVAWRGEFFPNVFFFSSFLFFSPHPSPGKDRNAMCILPGYVLYTVMAGSTAGWLYATTIYPTR